MVQVVRCLLVQRKVWLCNMLAEMLVEGEGNAGRVRAVSQGDARVGMAGRRAAEGAGEGAAVRWEPWGGGKSRARASPVTGARCPDEVKVLTAYGALTTSRWGFQPNKASGKGDAACHV